MGTLQVYNIIFPITNFFHFYLFLFVKKIKIILNSIEKIMKDERNELD